MGADGTRMRRHQAWVWLVIAFACCIGCTAPLATAGLHAADTVNQEGRRLTPPTVSAEVLYTAGSSADAIMANTQIFPTNNAWNEDISALPVASNSATLIAANGTGVSLAVNDDMPFVIVPSTDPLIAITYGAYASESDPGPYRLPLSAPIEGGSSSTGDRHVFSIDPVNGILYELYRAFPQASSWKADCSCKWNLNSNALRTDGWTSCDASGMSVFAGVVRYDECQRGMVEHAIRVTFNRTTNSHIYPATHDAGSAGADRIRMGERFRLKASVNISSLPAHAKAIALALKKYGAICADNGSNWRISNVPDSRFSGLSGLSVIHGSDFEVVQTTGATGGPRAAGAGNTCVHAGNAQTITLPASATLDGAANDPDTTTLIFAWTKTSGLGTVSFSNTAVLNPTASFSTAGTYVLQLSAREGTKPAATATVTITVNSGSGNQAPQIVSGANASPNPVVNQATTSVTVTATDPDSGPSALTYTWSKVSGPGTVTFSPNGTTGSATSTATFSAAGTYSLQVSVSDGAAATTSSVSGLVVTLPTAPTITTPPANKSVAVGATATFSVVASGSPTLSYQWQKGTTNIGGATSSTYTTPITVLGDSGTTYRVKVTNGVGSVTSASATLTVGSPPSITTQPANQTVTAGNTATFSVVAGGSATLTYQWQKGTTNIGGATSSSYTTPVTVVGDSGSTYRVIVTNPFGTVTSSSRTLTVNAAPNPVTVTVASVTLTAPPGSTTLVTRTLTLVNGTASAVTVTPTTTGGGTWLTTSGAVVVPAHGSITLTITGNPTGQTGTVNATLTLTNSPGGQTQTLPVSLTLVAPASGGGKSSGCAVGSGNSPDGWIWIGLGFALALVAAGRRQTSD